jgi:hypothetical protein
MNFNQALYKIGIHPNQILDYIILYYYLRNYIKIISEKKTIW